MDAELEALLERAKAKVAAMMPAEYEQMKRDQRASWVRAFAPCEHGMVDFEDCPDCRARYAPPAEPETR